MKEFRVSQRYPPSPFPFMSPFILTQNAENLQKQELDRTHHFEKINYVELSVSEGKSTVELLFNPTRQGPPWGAICKYHILHNSVHREDSYVGFLNLKNASNKSCSIMEVKLIKQNVVKMGDS